MRLFSGEAEGERQPVLIGAVGAAAVVSAILLYWLSSSALLAAAIPAFVARQDGVLARRMAGRKAA